MYKGANSKKETERDRAIKKYHTEKLQRKVLKPEVLPPRGPSRDNKVPPVKNEPKKILNVLPKL